MSSKTDLLAQHIRCAALVTLVIISVFATAASRSAALGLAPGHQDAQATTSVAKVHIDLGQLPSGWTKSEHVMDPIWQPLNLTGMNYFAFGAPVPPNQFAARSDPSSPLYQAWFGVYVINGGRQIFVSADPAKEYEWLVKFAELDQSAWLAAMGDSNPQAKGVQHSGPRTVIIDGSPRTIYDNTITSHSDLGVPGPTSTPLSRMLGMPSPSELKVPVKPFHPLTLRGSYAFWYDSYRAVTFVVYMCASSFRADDGTLHDNGPALAPIFQKMIERLTITTVP
jgi:hypothetical protein